LGRFVLASPSFLIYLVIFLVAFIPRLLALDAYVAPDEGKWIYRSAHFLQGLLQGDLAQMTSIAATPDVEVLAPAVPTMWLGAFGLVAKFLYDPPLHSETATLIDYLNAIPKATEKIPLEVYPWTRFPTVLLTGLAIPVFYMLLLRLVGSGAALLAALLLALDPFFLGLSRVIHHDALIAVFTFLALLTLLLYRQQRSQQQATSKAMTPAVWLVISGLAAGLALLTKPTALYLVPFVGLFLLLENGLPQGLAGWRRVTLEAVVWGALTLVTFFLFWPALWVAPGATLTALLDRSANALSEGNNYSLLPAPDSPLPELGFLFYPVNWLFKSTLPVWIGLFAVLVGARRGRFTPTSVAWATQWLALFSLLFLLLLIPADTRDIRYFLPATLALHALAAVGIIYHLAPFIAHASRFASPSLLITLLLLIQLSLIIIYYPYYVDYLNPVAGGPWLAPRLVKIGSGEGLDQMGRYLDQKPNAKNLRVATSFWESFVPFFSGLYTKPNYEEEADYLIIYLRQIQNNSPFPEYWTYFSVRPPEYRVSLVGVDYVWLYPGPQLRQVRQANFDYGLRLVGYRLDRWAAQPGQTTTLTLVWANTTAASANQQVKLQLSDGAGGLWVEAVGPLLNPLGPSPVEGHYQLNLPADIPRGDYTLQVSLNNLSHPAGLIPVRRLDKPPVQYSTSGNFGDLLTFGGADITPLPVGEGGEPEVAMKLLWQARRPLSASYTTFVHVIDAAGNLWGQVDRIPTPGRSELPTDQWDVGEWIVDSFQLALKPDTPPGNYTLLIGVYNSQTVERLPLVDEPNDANVVELTSITVP
jgi:hypothetical protein